MKKIKQSFDNLCKFDELLKQLILRDIKIKYRRSYLGYVWSILNPLMTMTVLVIVFSHLFKRFDIDNFPLYLISGQIVFSFMSEATNMAVSSISNNASLIKKTYVPKYIFTLSKVGSSLVNLVFSMGALLLVMIFTGATFSWSLLFFPVLILQVFVFVLGLGLLLASMSVFFRDIQYLWSVILPMWMYLTPIFYPVSIIPESYRGLYQALNPMYWYVTQSRDIIVYAKFPEMNLVMMGSVFALAVFVFGAWVFNKKQDDFILYI